MSAPKARSRSRGRGDWHRLPERQRILLQLLCALDGSATRLDFQKILFLYCQDCDDKGLYDFVPYKYGAFSFTSYADYRKLATRGWITEDNERWVLTDKGRKIASAVLGEEIATFVKGLKGLRGDSLVAETYRRFPYYAIRSEVLERVLKGDQVALKRVEEERTVVTRWPLLTIGYEGRSLEAYLNTLIQAGANILCDVRKNPVSRKYGFSQGTLRNACGGVGIRYEHFPQLGIASDERTALDTQEDYDALFKRYKRNTLPKQGKALNAILEWIRGGASVALTCYERLPEQCHRHCVAEALEEISSGEYPAQHL